MTDVFQDEQFHLRMRNARQDVKDWHRMERRLASRGLKPMPTTRAVILHDLEPGLVALFGDVGENQ